MGLATIRDQRETRVPAAPEELSAFKAAVACRSWCALAGSSSARR